MLQRFGPLNVTLPAAMAAAFYLSKRNSKAKTAAGNAAWQGYFVGWALVTIMRWSGIQFTNTTVSQG